MVERLTCVVCPLGCELTVQWGNGLFSVEGNRCDKGEDFARSEIAEPTRNFATSVPISGGKAFSMLSVRLSTSVPLETRNGILEEISKLRPEAPVGRGEILLKNVLGTGADVIATRTVEEKNSPGSRGKKSRG